MYVSVGSSTFRKNNILEWLAGIPPQFLVGVLVVVFSRGRVSSHSRNNVACGLHSVQLAILSHFLPLATCPPFV
jgi:hypothetical protein